MNASSHPDSIVSLLEQAKRHGFSDRQLSQIWQLPEETIRAARYRLGIIPAYRLVDTCAAEFEAATPYYYSSYDRDVDEVKVTDRPKIVILGGGPNRIGQGIEFDYCCVHAAFALRELGYETIMVNSNPETVSTDYDTSDKLFFEPLTLEDVLHIIKHEQPKGVIVQFGGQTPLNLAAGLREASVPIIGTSVESIERAEDRRLFAEMLDKLGLNQPPNGTATCEEEAISVAQRIGYPVLVRPSFVLGGRAMQIVYHPDDLRHYMRNAISVSPDRPVLIDRFLEEAIEVDVDCIADGEISVIGAIMQHIEQAGVHSGDSACVIPAPTLSKAMKNKIREATHAMAKELNVVGLMNVQFAIQGETLYVLEVNPRASRTVPFVSKAIGVPLAKLAAKIMVGHTLKDLGFTEEIEPSHYSVKEAVFPFSRFPGVDILLGPEMKSTGEVMGIDTDLGIAYAKAQMAASPALPTSGRVFISVRDEDKPHIISVAQSLHESGLKILATNGTAQALQQAGVPCESVYKLTEGRPNVLDRLKNGEIHLIINTPAGKTAREDEVKIRTTALQCKVPVMTTVAAARASAEAIRSMRSRPIQIRALQEYHPSETKIK
ncbi:MAG: carbamoyl-phosphate synthase large subunit [Methylacidiphilales bacterium]|nr:carbamoyl-phosphate synthase large subunit [Candidatus Methylacidiphilales bacterium]